MLQKARFLSALLFLGTLLAAPCQAADASSATNTTDTATASKQAEAKFNFDQFTQGKTFTLNTQYTTSYGPPWADISLKQANFLACKGAEIALCYYSGASKETPCVPGKDNLAQCTCYVIPAKNTKGQDNTYYVDINAILNLDVYNETVKRCGSDGSGCKPTGQHIAPVCDAIKEGKLIPGAQMVSTFSKVLAKELSIKPISCPQANYAGCMTAPCTKSGKKDAANNLELAECACPIWDGPYQFATGKNNTSAQCDVGSAAIWSAAYKPPKQKKRASSASAGSSSSSGSAN